MKICSRTFSDLPKYLNRIKKLYDIDTLVHTKISTDKTVEYYERSDVGYSLFNSRQGSVHMSLSFDGQYHGDGHFEQPRIIEKEVVASKAKNVLEISCGKGFNSLFLAKRNPGIQFRAIDITPSFLKKAIATAQRQHIENIAFQKDDFHKLHTLEDGTFDVAFSFESLCHSHDMKKTLEIISKKLKKGGKLGVFDGYRGEGFEQLTNDQKIAVKIVEKSMAVEQDMLTVQKFLEIAKKVGLESVKVVDYSENILPSICRFQLFAKGYFKFPFLSKILYFFISKELLINSIAGLLLPIVVSEKAHRYVYILLEKR